MKQKNPPLPAVRMLGLPPPVAITLTYLLYGLLWISFSDHIALNIAASEEELGLFSLIKGELFILVTTIILFVLLLRIERKRNIDRKALYEKEQRFKLAVESGGCGVWELDLIRNRLIWDERMYEIFNVRKEDFEGNYEFGQKYVHPDDLESAKADMAAAIAGNGSLDTAFRIIRPGGEIRHIRIYGKVLYGAAGRPDRVIGTVQDITETVQNELPFRMLFETTPNGVAIYKPSADFSDFTLVDINPAGREFAQLADGIRFIGRKVTEVFPGIEQSGLLEVFSRVARTGKTEHFPLTQYKDSRIELWVTNEVFRLPSGQIVAIFKDVSDLKKKEERIEDLSRFPEENINPVMRISTDGVLLYANSAGKALSAELFSGEPPRLNDLWEKRIEKSLQGGEVFQQNVAVGSRIFSVAAVPVKERNYLNIYAHDITLRVEAESRIAESRNRYSTLVSNLPGMAYSSRSEPYKGMDFVSAGCEPLTGFSSEELTASPTVTYRDLIHPEDRSYVRNEIQSALKKAEHYEIEYRIIRRDGAERLVWERGVGRYDSTKDEILLDGFVTDITDLRAATEQLKRLSEEQSLILNNSTLGIALVQDRVFKWVNPRLAEMCGVESGALDGQKTRCIYASEKDYLDVGKGYETLAYGERFECSLQFSRADGGLFWCRLIGKAIDPDKPHGGSIWMFEDITERKEAEEALHESREYLEAMWNAMDVGIMLVDAETETIIRVNPMLLELSGRSPFELIGQPCRKLVCKAKPGGCPVKDLGQEINHAECDLTCADGRVIDVEKSITVIELNDRTVYVETIVDITQRKQATASLARLSTAIEQSPEAIVITDTCGNIQYVNPAFERNTGYSREEALGQNPRVLKSGNHDDKFYESLWKTISAGKVWSGQLVNKRKDGTLFTENASISPVKDENGAIINYVAVKRDISQDLIREEELRRSQKLEAVALLAGSVAHDFNNILQGIMGFSSMLMKHLDPSSRQHDQANEIHKASIRAADLTRQLLAFNREQTVDFSIQNMNEVIADMYGLLEILMGESIEIELNLEKHPHKIYGDHGQLSQVIMNLAVNARDAMATGGKLTVSTRNESFTEEEAAMVQGALPGDCICLSVADTGSGMDDEIMNRLFEPFFTTKQIGSGTGLGLAVVYGIVTQNQGWIQVQSTLGKGSEFKLYFPARDAAVQTVENQEAGVSAPRKVLLVDDDDIVLQMNKSVLETAKYDVYVAGDAEEALQLFAQEHEEFDLLVSDLKLPGKSGIELADLLRETKPDLPVLIYSGYKDEVQQWDALHKKGYCFLEKPYKIMGFLVAVNETMVFRDK